MRLADFPLLLPEIFDVTVEPLTVANWNTNSEVQLWFDGSMFWLAQDGAPVAVMPQSPGLTDRLGRKELLWLLRSVRGHTAHLQCAEPADAMQLDTPLEICVDERIAEQLHRAQNIDRFDVAAAIRWCQSAFLIEGRPQRLAAVRFDSATPGEWQIAGNMWRADLYRNSDGKVMIKRIARSAHEPDSWTLVAGSIGFTDMSVATQLMSESQQAMLRQAVKTNGDYVELWKKYSDREWQRSLRQAGSLGVLQYKKSEEASDEGGVYRFFVDHEELAKFESAWHHLEGDGSLALEAHGSRPDWHSTQYQNLTGTDNNRRFRGRPRFLPGAVLIEADRSAPPEEGFLYLSLTGDRTVQERRQKALHSISTQARSLKLRYILQGVNVPAARTARYEPMTPSARACFKHGRATESQEAAIRTALETPDIALIIGPPGTGKTQVIAALSRRLAEIGGEGGAQHQVLITSFQHDAVENALDRTRVFDLPPVKVGASRKGEGADPVARWCAQKYDVLGEMLDQREALEPHVGLLNSLHLKLATLRHAQLDPGERASLLRDAAQLLQDLANTHRIRLPRALQDSWQDYLAQVPLATASPPLHTGRLRAQALKRVRALRITSEGFADDGAERAAAANVALLACGAAVAAQDFSALLELEGKQALDQAEAEQAALLRERLVDLFRRDYRPAAIRHRLDAEGQRLISTIEEALADKLKSSRLGISGVLARYRDAFINQPVRTRETVRTYAMVVGATCQQSASVEMASLKTLGGIDDAGIVFNTVIIDEAARANPLDLFIPMSMAGRRVILVGDHRQLPHLLEPEVEDELAEVHDLDGAQRKAFKESLFERLWRQLKERSDQDSFPRVVMLDTQFRMHPILGKLVSEQFYEKEGLPKLKPGRDESAFLDTIPGYEGKVCGWLDVPLRRGQEDRRGSSRIRIAEAQRVAAEVKRLLDAGGPDLSIGVITFYSAQRDVIFEELAQLGVTERDAETRAWQVSAPWNGVTTSGDEKLRIGTVDAFQGKEFDVVILSVVRANARLLAGADEPAAYEKAANGKFGHLRLSNRMNVAMSRQRSLLIAVGDRAMACGIEATAAVPALAAFMTLCEGEHGVVR